MKKYISPGEGPDERAELTEKWIIRLLKWFQVRTFLTRTVSSSVPEPNPDLAGPHVFGPPESEAWIRGSGSTPTCHGSGTMVSGVGIR